MANITFKGKTLPGLSEKRYKYKDFDPNMRLLSDTGKLVTPDPIMKNEFKQLIDMEAVMNGLHNIFEWEKGSRILLPEFGSDLKSFLYEPIDEKRLGNLKTSLINSINRWEPRIFIKRFDIIITPEMTEQNTIQIELEFTVPSLNNQSFVFKDIFTE